MVSKVSSIFTMIPLHSLICLSAVVAVSFGADPRIQSKKVVQEVNLNDAFDKALPQIRQMIVKRGMDPMNIPDVDIPLSLLPAVFNTKMHLHNGYVQQISTIVRTGNIILQYSEKKFTMYMNVGWESLDISHEYTLRYMLYTRKGDCNSRFYDIDTRMLVTFNVETRKIDLKLIKFQSVGKFEFTLEGHLTDGLINLITKAITTVFREQVLRQIEAKVYKEIDKIVAEINDLIPEPIDTQILSKEVNDDYEPMEEFKPYSVDGLGRA